MHVFYRILVLVMLTAGLTASTLVLTGCYVSTARYDLSRPISTQDWLIIWEDPADVTASALQTPDYRILAGQEIFGMQAPLDNYLEVFPLGTSSADGTNGAHVEDWIDSLRPAMYFLPLYDDAGDWQRSLLIWREQHTAMIAHSFDDDYQKYLTAKGELTSFLIGTYGNAYKHSEYRIYWSWIGIFVLAENEEGSYGQFFSDFAVAEDQVLPYSFEELEGRVMSEAELIEIFEAIEDAVSEP
ncbi:MAG: hypothetical protein FWC86_03010 [Coriobacteriia bacterium]|nr:hypothetical protein [Coriobacteriia bacterium]